MRLAQPVQAFLFLLFANYCFAESPVAAVPLPAHRVPGESKYAWLRSWQLKPLIGRGDLDTTELTARQDGGSCDRRARCKRNKIRNPTDSTKCVRCPPGMKADPTHTTCLDDPDTTKDQRENDIRERMKEKMKEKAKDFRDKLQERFDKKKDKKAKEYRKERKKGRNSRCLATMLSLGVVAANEGLPDEGQLAAAAGEWPDDVEFVEGDLKEEHFKVRLNMQTTIISARTKRFNLGAIFGAIGRTFSSLGKGGRASATRGGLPKGNPPGRGGQGGTATIKKVQSHPNYRSCLALAGFSSNTSGDTVSEGKEIVTYDPKATPADIKATPPEVEPMSVIVGDAEDWRPDPTTGEVVILAFNTYSDRYDRYDRLNLETCHDVPGSTNGKYIMNDKMTSFAVDGGCCAFYRDIGCKDLLFSATNREHSDVKGKDKDSMSSLWCTKDLACKGMPP